MLIVSIPESLETDESLVEMEDLVRFTLASLALGTGWSILLCWFLLLLLLTFSAACCAKMFDFCLKLLTGDLGGVEGGGLGGGTLAVLSLFGLVLILLFSSDVLLLEPGPGGYITKPEKEIKS